MKPIVLLFIAGIALASCTKEGLTVRDEAPRINVTVAGFTSTRAAENGYATVFTNGDRIGITVLKTEEADTTILEDNVPYRYDGSAWHPANSATAIHRHPGATTCLVYYPFDAAMSGRLTAGQLLEAFTPAINQGSYALYTASDLMTGTGTFAGAALDVTLVHALSLVEIELPAGSADVTLKVNDNEFIPCNISGSTYRCLVQPESDVTLGGEYRHAGVLLAWQKSGVDLASGEYGRLEVVNNIYSGSIKVNYTDGESETVQYAPLTGEIPFTQFGKTIEGIELLDAGGKTYSIGRLTSGALTLKLLGNGDLEFRPADPDGVIPIGSYAEFQLIHNVLDGSYRQEADIDLMNREWMPVGSEETPFSGSYDGGNHTIVNLKIERDDANNRGLFGYTNEAEIRDLHIASGKVKGGDGVGGICGYMDGGLVTACSNAAVIEGNNSVGGVAGYNGGSVIACCNTGTVTGNDHVGGIAGINSIEMTIACYNTGTVTGHEHVGGITGVNDLGHITACYSTGTVVGNAWVGGIAGINIGDVAACYWVAGTAGTGVNNFVLEDEEDDIEGTDTDVVAFTLPPGFTPDPLAYPPWGIGDGNDNNYWKNYTGNGGLPRLWWE
ncbi:MAG: fimbrillin family protein [Odoribacteraceae bacterium]|jgi:hypothetical protein|nr:fimbrillin family protein [Odoribacteraceae bacterium]